MGMGPGIDPKECDNEELVSEFENACRAGDREFADEYKAEIIKRLGPTSVREQDRRRVWELYAELRGEDARPKYKMDASGNLSRIEDGEEAPQ